MMTPAGCGACSPTNGPRSCSPLSLTTLAPGGYRWTSKPTTYTPAGAKPTTKPHQIPGPPSNGAGPPTPADGTALTSTPCVPVKPARMTREPTFRLHQRTEPTMPEKGGDEHLTRVFDTL